jgi:hypothetical protein
MLVIFNANDSYIMFVYKYIATLNYIPPNSELRMGVTVVEGCTAVKHTYFRNALLLCMPHWPRR